VIKRIALVVGILVAAVLVYAATRSDTLRVQRTATIKAPAEKIFPLINDLHTWRSWSAYEKVDPAMTRAYSGAPDGKGAVYEWEGDSNVGQGRMEITGTARPSRITIKLDFIKPFEGHNVAEFALVPQGDATNVTWTMDGPTPYLGKLIGVFINMDTMIGKDFETGLANLKTIAETRDAALR
jgi:polyketide cyclase/dehydrase/lipid transport protein